MQSFYDGCLNKCNEHMRLAEAVVEEKKKRDQENAASFTRNPGDFFANRMVPVTDALKIERANLCTQRCQEPVDVLKRLVSANLKEININIKNCVSQAQEIGSDNKIKVDYDRAELCYERNFEILQLMNSKLNANLQVFKSEFMI